LTELKDSELKMANRFNRPLLLYTAESPTETPGFLLRKNKKSTNERLSF